MATKVLMEALSPTMEEGKVLSWLKREGDTVSSGEVLAEVETDKAVMELQARGSGVLRKILAGDGATVEVGSIVGIIAAADEDIGSLLQADPSKQAPPQAEAAKPAASRPPPKPESPAMAAAATTAPPSAGRVKASPLARRLAEDRGLELAGVSGSGPGGRIVKRDVERAAIRPLPVAAGTSSGYEDVELSQIRKTIAKRLVQSLGPIPHFFLTTEVDMERAADARAHLNGLDDGPRISFNDIILKAVAAALTQHRDCNAWWLDGKIRYFNEVHLSVAVAVQDGLITPVIRNAHMKSLRQIAAESRELADRARNRKLTPEEYTGGTFSVSNLGMFDIDQFTGVINPPEAGLIAVGSIAEKPVVVDADVTVRRRMRLTMSCDHRVIDGATGARFLQTVRRMLENPLAIVW
ncbi:MAG: 2-oxo acid dehydrogenase subunit E2 [Gemmatimonadota bacterium]|nr:2-oxo acid dehydrogenase subunit E2 [Gemmatimonadota bacterium]MDH3367617.1 2-oxo acid dehydrogenase subunit E2 [Gemmatimonadota bacterium]MDH3479154.1 2-oxo acid dehydrogenase subunit E2 [Gemmatimonadota bacterium]MDH3569294.1 2-oxo acid dehydrogenase subunit E2 [Gemmatimonadota bacterium]MDH5549118.1 2-oxo acid dehydrogenase subunit E2 [Gemmatimonadota bacterium]